MAGRDRYDRQISQELAHGDELTLIHTSVLIGTINTPSKISLAEMIPVCSRHCLTRIDQLRDFLDSSWLLRLKLRCDLYITTKVAEV